MPNPFVEKETKTQKKSHGAEETGGQCSLSNSATNFSQNQREGTIAPLCLDSEVAMSRVFLSMYFLLAEPPFWLDSQLSLSSRKMRTSQPQAMNIDYSISITLTVISINMDM